MPTNTLTLDQLPKRTPGRILLVGGADGITLRLLEMGLTEGEQITLIGRAPLGDPLEFLIRGYRLSIRSSEAQRIQVELV